MGTTHDVPGPAAAAALGHLPDRLLVPLDLSEMAMRALPPAVTLATRLGVPVTLFGWHWDLGEAAAIRRHLTDLAADLRLPAGVEVDVECTEDRSPVGPLLRRLRADPSTLPCMATHARRGLGAAVLGSVCEDVLRCAARPVLLVGPRADPAASFEGPVVVPLDGSSRAEAAVAVGAAWARRLGAPLDLVSVVDPPAPDLQPQRHDLVEDAYLGRLARSSGTRVRWSVLQDANPARAITDHAAGRAALIAMTTHGRTGLGRMVAGSEAIATVRRAACPVLLVPTPTRT